MSDGRNFLLDTNILSDLINRGRESPVAAMLDSPTTQVATSVVVAAEI